jgi:dual specificity protein phosphatase-like protein
MRSANRVDSHVFIGGYLAASDPDFIKSAGITKIVKLFADDRSYRGGATRLPGVEYLVLPCEDRADYDIREDAYAALRYIKNAIDRNELILVHCHAGVSRSATVVLLHLMIHSNYLLAFAMERLKMTRPVINPNPGFMAHLRATDNRLKQLRVGDERRGISPPPILNYELTNYERFPLGNYL